VSAGSRVQVVVMQEGAVVPLYCTSCGRVLCCECAPGEAQAADDADGVRLRRLAMTCDSCGGTLKILAGLLAGAPEAGDEPMETQPRNKAIIRSRAEIKRQLAEKYEEENAARKLANAPILRRGVPDVRRFKKVVNVVSYPIMAIVGYGAYQLGGLILLLVWIVLSPFLYLFVAGYNEGRLLEYARAEYEDLEDRYGSSEAGKRCPHRVTVVRPVAGLLGSILSLTATYCRICGKDVTKGR
jgi:hypothetical protein